MALKAGSTLSALIKGEAGVGQVSSTLSALAFGPHSVLTESKHLQVCRMRQDKCYSMFTLQYGASA